MWWVTPSPPPDLGPKLSLNKWIFSIAFNLPIGWLITCSTDWLSDQLAIWQASNYWINADCKNRFCNFVRVWFQATFSHFPSVSIIHIQFSNSLSSNCFQFLFSLSNMAICRDLTRLQFNIFSCFWKHFYHDFVCNRQGKDMVDFIFIENKFIQIWKRIIIRLTNEPKQPKLLLL